MLRRFLGARSKQAPMLPEYEEVPSESKVPIPAATQNSAELRRSDFVGLGLRRISEYSLDFIVVDPTGETIYYIQIPALAGEAPTITFHDGEGSFGGAFGVAQRGVSNIVWELTIGTPGEDITTQRVNGKKYTTDIQTLNLVALDKEGQNRSILLKAETKEGDRPKRYTWKRGDLYPNRRVLTERQKVWEEEDDNLFIDSTRKISDQDLHFIDNATGEIMAVFSAEPQKKPFTVGGFYLRRGMSLSLHTATLISGVAFVHSLRDIPKQKFGNY